MLIAIVSSNSIAGIFGPSSYEDCLLDNLKEAKTSEAVQAMRQACALKFPAKPEQHQKPTGLKICKLYWDGWKLAVGGKPNSEYNVYAHSFQGADALEISIPKPMATYLEVDNDAKMPELSLKSKYGKFFADNYSSIKSLCAFN